jgi:hypothetical protein
MMFAVMDSAIIDPVNSEMIGLIYETEALPIKSERTVTQPVRRERRCALRR